ncbi:hypothetical protein VNO80_14565 [Phaseolus coccineus]|uniref:DUF7651 domain-containing protein n=1 Tax=Phaseolus coccineus TaxID=3886 RepID=A0AAN9R1I2_PHACN
MLSSLVIIYVFPCRSHLEEELTANKSLSIYCRPVELCNIIQRRAMMPIFLRRCLRCKILEKHKKRIQMTVCVMKNITNRTNIFPIYICLARQIYKTGAPMDSVVYQLGRIFIFRKSSEVYLDAEVQAEFTLPEMNRLAKEAKSGTIDVLFVSTPTVEDSYFSHGVNSNLSPLDLNHLPFGDLGEFCLLGKVSLESLYMSWNYFPTFRLGQRAELYSSVDMHPCLLKSLFEIDDAKFTIHVPPDIKNMNISKELHVRFSAEQFGSKEKPSGPFMRRI